MTSWHVIPDRSLGKVGIQVYRDGQLYRRIALADVGIPEGEVGFVCSWLPEKLAVDPDLLKAAQPGEPSGPYAEKLVPLPEKPGEGEFMDIGEKLQHWHAGQGDPIYALGSYFFAYGKPPEEEYYEEEPDERTSDDVGADAGRDESEGGPKEKA